MFKQFQNAVTFFFKDEEAAKSFNELDLQATLEYELFEGVGERLLKSAGFAPVFSGLVPKPDDKLFHVLPDGSKLICQRTEKRLLPSKVVNKEVAARIKLKSKEIERDLSRPEELAIKQAVTLEFIPKSFTEDSFTYALIMKDRIIVSAGSPTAGEQLISKLRKGAGSLKVRPIYTKKEFSYNTHSLLDGIILQAEKDKDAGLPINENSSILGFDIGDTFHLQSNGMAITIKHCQIDTPQLITCIKEGMRPTQLELGYEIKFEGEEESSGHTWFNLNEKLQMKGISWSSALTGKSSDDCKVEDKDSRRIEMLEADITICASELVKMTDKYVAELGGLV